MIIVVGPSGAGKDAVLSAACQQFADDPRVVLVRRTITRPAGDSSERHNPVDLQQFAQMLSEGAFAAHWRAHGLCYGLPVQTLANRQSFVTLGQA